MHLHFDQQTEIIVVMAFSIVCLLILCVPLLMDEFRDRKNNNKQ